MEAESSSDKKSFTSSIEEIVFLSTSAIVIYAEAKPIIEMITEIVAFTTISTVTFEQLYLFIQMLLIEIFIKSTIIRIVVIYIFGVIYSLC